MDARWTALALLTVARATVGFQFQSVASVAPILVRDLGLDYADLGTLIGLYFLPGVILALPAGMLGRRFGDRQVVVVGLVLMAAGGAMTGMAAGLIEVASGRVVSGIGAVLLNVVMSKMVTDWFAGRQEIVLAMAIFVSSFPIGIGLAVLSLGALAETAGWSAALVSTAGPAAMAALLIGRCYVPHPNNGPITVDTGKGVGISVRETVLVSLAGAIWGLLNGAVSVMFGFAPTTLVAAGLTPVNAGVLVGLASWCLVASIQAGGIVAQRWGRPDWLMILGTIAWCASLLTMASEFAAAGLLAAGAIMGLPVGIIMALPAQALRPEARAVGMGVFSVWNYVGMGGLPPVAGWLQDRTGIASAPFWFAAMAVLAMLPLYALFRIAVRRGIGAGCRQA